MILVDIPIKHLYQVKVKKEKKMQDPNILKVGYNIELEVKDDVSGETLEKRTIHNLITNAGKQRVAELLNNVSSTYFRAIAIGTGTNAAAVGDTQLQTEVKRSAATLTYEASYKAKFVYLFTFTTGEAYAITEVGVLDNATSGGVLLNRAVSAAINVDNTKTLSVTVTVSVS